MVTYWNYAYCEKCDRPFQKNECRSESTGSHNHQRTNYMPNSRTRFFHFWVLLQWFCLFTFLVSKPLLSIAATGKPATPLSTADDLYELDNLLKIELFIEQDAWDKVRFSWRGEDYQQVNGKWKTIQADYEHQPGDVVINGVRIENVGIRKKGFFGSLSTMRPALKVKFDKYVKGQDFFGIKDLTLNNNKTDLSQVKQYVSYKWFRHAGVQAPRCNFSQVYVNGAYLGIYSNVEFMGKRFLKERFGSSKGTLYEGTVADFLPFSGERFEAKNNKKSDDKSEIRKIVKLLKDLKTVDMEALERHVDLDKFMNFWIGEMMLGHWDGYVGHRNNFFFYVNPKSEKVEFIPWGTDGTFGKHLFVQEKYKIAHGLGRLPAALYSNAVYRQKYLKRVEVMMSDWWDTEELLADVKEASDLVRPHIHLPENTFDEALAELREYIKGVPAQITDELRRAPDQWPIALPEDRSPVKNKAPTWAGTVKGDFLIPYGHYGFDQFTDAGKGSVEIIFQGKRVEFPQWNSTAGFGISNPGPFDTAKVLLGLASPEKGRKVWVYMDMDPSLLDGARDIRLHKSSVISWFGTMSDEKPEDPIVHGRVEGMVKAKLVDVEGVKHLKGSIDAKLLSGRRDFEFYSE